MDRGRTIAVVASTDSDKCHVRFIKRARSADSFLHQEHTDIVLNHIDFDSTFDSISFGMLAETKPLRGRATSMYDPDVVMYSLAAPELSEGASILRQVLDCKSHPSCTNNTHNHIAHNTSKSHPSLYHASHLHRIHQTCKEKRRQVRK